MSTLADIRKVSDIDVRTFVDDTTPQGTFIALATLPGVRVDYLLRGSAEDENAVIVGRTEFHPEDKTLYYTGSGIRGGQWMLRGSLATTRSTHEIMAR